MAHISRDRGKIRDQGDLGSSASHSTVRIAGYKTSGDGGPASFGKLLGQWEEGLAIDEHDLSSALLSQPDLFYRVSQQLAILLSKRDQAKQSLAEMEAHVDRKERNAAASSGERATEKEIESRKRLNQEVLSALNTLNHWNEQVGLCQALKDAFVQRSYVLKDLVALYQTNYYGTQDAGGRGGSEMKERLAERNKQARLRGD